MISRKKILKKIFKTVKSPVKKLRILIKSRLGWLGIPAIVAFRGYGNASEVIIKGMVTEDKGIQKPKPEQSNWENFLAMIKRFSGDEIPGVDVEVGFYGQQQRVTTNEYGIFEARFDGIEIPQNKLSLLYEARLIDEIVEEQPIIRAKGEVYFPGKNSKYAVVSDIDDTIIVSHASKTIRKLRLMLVKNAMTRTAFPGVSEFYNALKEGHNQENNAFFYVSSSEWNLFDLLRDFFTFNDFPDGPLMLREMNVKGFKLIFSGKGKHEHKIDKIEHLLDFYPHLQFILIGDSGQKDPDIYSDIVKRFHDRIAVVYIRHIRAGLNEKKFLDLANNLKKIGKDMILVGSTTEAARHAARFGYIKEKSLEEVGREKEKEESEQKNL